MTQIDPPKVRPAEREWLKYDVDPESDKRPRIKWTSKSTEGRIEISNLTKLELEAMEAFLNGTSYTRTVNGRMHAYDVMEPLPGPEKDPLMGPHWGDTGEIKVFGGLESEGGWHSPGITITGLGASIDTAGDMALYRKLLLEQQFKLQEAGFICLRSPRANNGGYWEQWVLHGLWCAKGTLGFHMDKFESKDWKLRVEEACRYIARDMRISFGSMDITIQRWALCAPD